MIFIFVMLLCNLFGNLKDVFVLRFLLVNIVFILLRIRFWRFRMWIVVVLGWVFGWCSNVMDKVFVLFDRFFRLIGVLSLVSIVIGMFLVIEVRLVVKVFLV